MRRKLRLAKSNKEIVRARFGVGWWVKTYVGSDLIHPITEVWFLFKRSATRFANG